MDRARRIVVDVWGGEQNAEHVARYVTTPEQALLLAYMEVKSGFIISMAASIADERLASFDKRAGTRH